MIIQDDFECLKVDTVSDDCRQGIPLAYSSGVE